MKDNLTFEEMLRRMRLVEAKVTPFQIEEFAEKKWLKLKHEGKTKGLTKDQYIEATIKGPEKKLSRCENCKDCPCVDFKFLKEENPLVAIYYYVFYARDCDNFKPKLLHNKDNIKGE